MDVWEIYYYLSGNSTHLELRQAINKSSQKYICLRKKMKLSWYKNIETILKSDEVYHLNHVILLEGSEDATGVNFCMGAEILEDENHVMHECNLYTSDIRTKLIARLRNVPYIQTQS